MLAEAILACALLNHISLRKRRDFPPPLLYIGLVLVACFIGAPRFDSLDFKLC